MAKSKQFNIFFLIFISFCCYKVFSIDSFVWRKVHQKFCVEKSTDEKELKYFKECDSKLTKERKSLLSYCIDGIDSPLSDKKPKICQLPTDWSIQETKLFYHCMSKNATEVYKNSPQNLVKDYNFDICVTKLLAINGWENLCITSNIPTYKAKMKVCADTHPLIKQPIKECVAKDSSLRSKIANILPVACQYINYYPQLYTCIQNYEKELMKDTELWEKYQARRTSFHECHRKIAEEMIQTN